MKKFCDIYVESLYSACGGYPLWNPHGNVRLGDIGFVRDGSFITLFNAGQGPSEVLSDAENMALAARTRSSSNSNPSSPPNNQNRSLSPSTALQSDITASGNPPLTGRSSSRSPSASPPTSRRSSIGRSLFHSNPEPPLPLIMEEIQRQRFDAGPRTSSNFHCLGFSIGASVPGAPVAGTIEFETSGGTGGFLVQRSPTERLSLAHEGVLRKYLSQHAEWMLNRYGPPEDIDQVVLVTGLENTSDWAMAISDESSRSAKIELEIFTFGKPGLWCEFKGSCTASQRGPHRDSSQHQDRRASTGTATGRETTPTPTQDLNSNGQNVPTTSKDQSHSTAAQAQAQAQPFASRSGAAGGQANPSGLATSLDASMDVDSDTSASFHFGLKMGEVGYQAMRSEDGQGSSLPQPEIEWSNSNPFPPTESVVLQRLTAKLNPFRGVRLKAAAEPRPDPAQEREDRSFDPLNLLHGFIQSRHQEIKASIASDSDCLKVLNGLAICTAAQMERALTELVNKRFRIIVDENGVGALEFLDSDPTRSVARESHPSLQNNTPIQRNHLDQLGELLQKYLLEPKRKRRGKVIGLGRETRFRKKANSRFLRRRNQPERMTKVGMTVAEATLG